MSWQTALAIGSGGFIGAISRSYINGLISHKIPHTLPFGTLGVNLLGSFIMGLLMAYFMYSTILSPHVKSFLTTGFLGALTTYSTFAMESFLLFNGGSILLALTNMTLNVVGSVVMAGSGYYIIENLFRK